MFRKKILLYFYCLYLCYVFKLLTSMIYVTSIKSTHCNQHRHLTHIDDEVATLLIYAMSFRNLLPLYEQFSVFHCHKNTWYFNSSLYKFVHSSRTLDHPVIKYMISGWSKGETQHAREFVPG